MNRASIAAGVLTMAAVAGCATPGERPTDLTTLTATQAVALLKSGRITSVELTHAYLRRIDAHPELNAFITLDRAGALAEAAHLDQHRAQGQVEGPLHGLPLVIKDNIHVKGLPSTAGTPALRGFVPAKHAPVVQKLVDAGAVILGKTNMHELAFGISGYNEGFRTGTLTGVRNPYDTTRFAGGSSSGTAAAVAARMAPAGLGSDTGGSTRVPAAVTGGAGFRPSPGRYSQEGIAPISHTRDTAGPMARTVADIVLLDSVITGSPLVKPASLKGVRLGVYRKAFFANLDADTQAVTDAALGRLRDAGVEIVEVDMPALQSLHQACSFPVALYEAYDDLAQYLNVAGTGKTIADVAAGIASADVKGTYESLVLPRKLPGPNGLVDAAPVYRAAMTQARPALIRHYADTFSKYRIDALVFPTTPRVAAKQGPEASSLETFLLFIQNTDPGSMAGVPGLSIPAGLGASGLPVGLEIDGPAGSDARLLALGMAIEKLLGPTPAPR